MADCFAESAGDHSGGATPVPIPNTAVKPSSADGTCGATHRESRTSPAYLIKNAIWATSLGGVFVAATRRSEEKIILTKLKMGRMVSTSNR